ncbi:E3 ubiquitin-protein ligase RSL1-like [Malania oleifera]|uniref:E3 ubiquitin-protein ligase RSL1-like n=1 Tax=Malania oleifera TaxID=397392 RepID=UPI0025AE3007|nr:E3 ubiquitin-protein ligase RSL1-like [Malania oleifera]
MATTNAEDAQTMMAEQWRELQVAKALDSDLDVAFRLQMQEAMAASLVLRPSSSSSPLSPLPPSIDVDVDDDDFLSLAGVQAEEIARFEQERRDREYVEAVMRGAADDLRRRTHDQKLASDILQVPEEEWSNTGDYFRRPYGEGSSSGGVESEACFRLYFKGLVSEEIVGESTVMIAGVGVAICDPKDNLIFELRKPLAEDGLGRELAELEALIECLNTALILDLKRVLFLCDDDLTYLYVTGRWPPAHGKIAALVNQVDLLQKKFTYCNSSLVARNHIKFAYKLARVAITSQLISPAESSHAKKLTETCKICFEDTDVGQMISVDGCLHRYCISCLRKHVVVKLYQALVPNCPHEGCRSMLHIDRCRRFLTPELIELMTLRIKEASIPATEKVYCPYPQCSALMSRNEVLEHSREIFNSHDTKARKCIKCRNLFCINCKVPWHNSMTCNLYRRENPYPCVEDVKLKSLATTKLWRQCVKCNHMIELAEGCNHIYCRCGYEFCYTCGAEWKNKKATCRCPLWEEHNILYAGNGRQQRRG